MTAEHSGLPGYPVTKSIDAAYSGGTASDSTEIPFCRQNQFKPLSLPVNGISGTISDMAKRTTMFECINCGYTSVKQMGRCPECGEWNTFKEQPDFKQIEKESRTLTLETISDSDSKRFKTNIEEIDRVLGGGVVEGSVVLFGGEPGVGKSTLMLAIAQTFSKCGMETLYCSGEESQMQVSMRAKRIGATGKDIYLAFETDLGVVLEEARKRRPKAIFIDSIQTITDTKGMSGSPSNLRETTRLLVEFAKSLNVTVFIIGHVTKEGSIAGPKTLEHLVDVVCYIEGERYSTLRILHCVKNRFGATDEVGLLEMTEKGFIPADRMSLFSHDPVPGIAVTAVSMGNRPFALEVQALTAPTYYPAPRRVVTGCSLNRTLMLIAVLEKRLNMPIGKMDVYVNLVGGISTEEPALDLGVSMAVASSFLDKPVPSGTAFIGEVGLTGEVRPVTQMSARLKELATLGVKTVVCPKQDHPDIDGLDIIEVTDLVKALKIVWPAK